MISLLGQLSPPSPRLTFLDNRLDMPSDHLLQYGPQHTALDVPANHALAPFALLSQAAVDLLEVGRRLEFGGETSGFGLEVLTSGGEEWGGEESGERLRRESGEKGDDGGEERARNEIAVTEEGEA